MKFFLLISLFLAYPVLSGAKVLVSCNESVQLESSISGLCLPDRSGNFTSQSSSWGNFIFGLGNTFGEAWDDAQNACFKLLQTVSANSSGRFSGGPTGSICHLNHCRVLDLPPKMTINDVRPLNCFCLNTNSNCKKEALFLPSDHNQARNHTDLFNSGLAYCKKIAQESNITGGLQVYCTFRKTANIRQAGGNDIYRQVPQQYPTGIRE